MSQSRGLGDDIKKITQATGLDQLAKRIAQILDEDCGCDDRQTWLNEKQRIGLYIRKGIRMALINKTGITTGGTIQAEHVTRAIDALSGGSTDTIVATGSFSGSLVGTSTSASFATSASQAVTASFALNAGGSGFPFTGSAQITGSLIVTGSFQQRGASGVLINSTNDGTLNMTHDTIDIKGSNISLDIDAELDLSEVGKGSGFRIPLNSSGLGATTGSMYFDSTGPALYIYDGTQWTFITLGT